MLFTRVCPQLVFLYKKKEYNLNVSILSTDVHNSVQIVKYERYQNLNLKFEKRFDALNSKYLKSLKNKNELIKDHLDEYWKFSESRQLSRNTLFCKYIKELKPNLTLV